MIIGTKVRPSGYSLRGKRDYWQSLGREPSKSWAKQDYEKARNKRGTVTGILTADKAKGISAGLEVTWDNGTVSRCLDYMVEEDKQ